ncbi:MAG: LysM peptidoglycan-binding domain-containing protein [Firmicutes bacterium]|nr:LysM peptidoglycan-binding domain-containing protein [Bacillota bacterium]
MSALPSISRRVVRSRWMEPVVTAVGAVILGLGFASTAASHVSPAPQSPHPDNAAQSTRTSPPEDLRQLIARASQRRIRLALKPAVIPPAGHVYHIQWGDTLWGLSQRFHVSLSALEAVNHLTSTQIEAGAYLVIPAMYQVQPGDTLATVAKKFSVPLLLLWHENRLTQDKLHPGQSLVIPYTGRIPQADYSAPELPAQPAAAPLTNRGAWNDPANLNAEDLLMLAHLVQAEAGNQPFLGQVAVAAVVLNRLKAPGFPKTLDSVLFSPGQFDSVANGSFWQPPTTQAMMAAKAAAAGWDPSGGALYFFNPSMPHAAWMNTLPESAIIGSQVFCR